MTFARNGAPKFDGSTRLRQWFINPVSWAALSIISVLSVGVGVTAVYLPWAMQSAAIDAIYRSNLEVAHLIKIVRGYYANDVVAKVARRGVLTPSYLHKDNPDAIPLPATFVKDMSDLLKDRSTSLSLVSPYPFRAGPLMDDFEAVAWEAFQRDPNAVFSRQETRDGLRVLRVAVADRMTTETCTNCHNSHPQSTKRDWKVGEVRAVMQVTRVVEPYLAAAEQRSWLLIWTLGLATMLTALALLAITLLAVRRTREKHQTDLYLSHLTHHDPLTNLPNRTMLRDRLERALSPAGPKSYVTVLILDIDRFKHINDAFGHAKGDTLLNAVAQRLRKFAGPRDTIARSGGDRFAIVKVAVEQRNDGTRLATRIIEAMNAPFELDGHEVILGVSIGIAASSSDGTAPEILLKQADFAAERAKSEGRGSFRVFEPVLDADATSRRQLEQDLHRALAGNEFELLYQPIQDTATRGTVAMETLVRWRHPRHGLLSPGKFIAIAEASGLIMPLGELVLRQACLDAVKWPSRIRVAVNLSPAQFQAPDLVGTVARILADSGLPSNRLELEITESVLLTHSAENIATLHRLRGLGVSIGLDDFGTGYSSLSYLQAFPFDKIKIDRSFVSEMSAQDACAAIVCAVANLGRSLNILTTAEGVETEEQFELVRAAGCTQAQGYLLGRPVPVTELDFGNGTVSGTIDAEMAPSSPFLPAKDIMLVRASFAMVVPIQTAVTDLFYDRLFAIAPELRTLFPADLTEQKLKLIAMLATGVGKLNDLASLAPILKGLGARHAGYGTTAHHYEMVAEALLWALERGLGDAFTPEVRAAWVKVYNLLAETMQAGVTDVTTVRAA